MLLRLGLKKLPLSFPYNVGKVTSVSLFRNYQNTNNKRVLEAKNSLPFIRSENFLLCSLKSQYSVVHQRYYAKKKKGSRMNTEDEESDTDSDDEDNSSDVEEGLEGSVVKNVQSLRIDSVLKAGLGISKKKIEKEFYAGKIRINSEKVLKKARTVLVGDDIDIIKGPSPDNDKFILVDRITLKAIGKVTSGGNFPLHMQVFKSLTIENYSEPWVKSSTDDD